jgi:thymidylate synthase
MKATARPTVYKYQPLYKPNQVICGEGQTVIITGWTVRKNVAKHLDSGEYAGIGNLYSPTRGISPLLRNLLANPHVYFLVVIQATKEDTNAGGVRCLLDFFTNGFRKGISDTGRDCWLINSEITGYIDIEIPKGILEDLRAKIEVKAATSITEAVEYTKAFAQQDTPENHGEALTFPLTEVTPTVLPGTRYGHRNEGKTSAETWVKWLHRIKTTGTISTTG